MLSLRRRSRSAPLPTRPDVRPGLEELENRITPSAAAMPAGAANATFSPTPTITNVNVAETFATFGGQVEVITGQVVFNGVPVTSGTVTVTDGGLTFTSPLDSKGDFTATFNFNLLQEFSTAPTHIATMSFSGFPVGSTTFGATSASVNTPDETLALEYQLLDDYYLLVALGF